jgi:uncharacterized protein (DUF2147 family)
MYLIKSISQTLTKFLILILFFGTSVSAENNNVTGIWQTIDDESHQVRSLVELSIVNNKLYGTIIKLYPQAGEPENPLCEICEGSNKNKPILGLQIIDGLSLKKDQWSDGTILDPNNGKSYDCKVWLEKNKLKVRGYIGFFFRTQEWLKYEPETP